VEQVPHTTSETIIGHYTRDLVWKPCLIWGEVNGLILEITAKNHFQSKKLCFLDFPESSLWSAEQTNHMKVVPLERGGKVLSNKPCSRGGQRPYSRDKCRNPTFKAKNYVFWIFQSSFRSPEQTNLMKVVPLERRGKVLSNKPCSSWGQRPYSRDKCQKPILKQKTTFFGFSRAKFAVTRANQPYESGTIGKRRKSSFE